jgi:cytochrome P450
VPSNRGEVEDCLVVSCATLAEDDPPGEARFESALGAWVLSSYADVSAALSDARLSVWDTSADGVTAHVAVRDAAAHALSPARLAAWRADIEASARVLIGRLPVGVPVDLVGAFVRPWSVELALRGTGAPPADAERLDRLAQEVFLAAASATDSRLQPPALAAVAKLASYFRGAGASADVQAYVALSQTLPCVLANAWLELFRRPDEADRLRAQPELMPNAVEELLRHASPARAVFRRALAEMSIGRASIAPGDRVIVLLSAANHDPARFPEPGRLDVRRDATGHVAFGRGAHSCPGAPLIRLAVAVATDALLAVTSAVEPVGEVEWIGGFAIRAPASLAVVLRRQQLDHSSSTA